MATDECETETKTRNQVQDKKREPSKAARQGETTAVTSDLGRMPSTGPDLNRNHTKEKGKCGDTALCIREHSTVFIYKRDL